MLRRTLAAALAASLLVPACSDNGDSNDQDSAAPPGDGGAETAIGGDAAAVDEPFGRACQLGKPCPNDQEGYPNLCVGTEGSTAGQGFCTRTCNAQGGGPECYGVPNGQWAACMLGGEKKDGGPTTNYCVFLCAAPQGKWTCPATLRCGPVKDDFAFCAP